MEELLIYKYQAEAIKEALRVVSNRLNCRSKETCLDRDVTWAANTIENIINKEPQKRVNRL